MVGVPVAVVMATQLAAPVMAGPLLPSNWPPAPTFSTKVWPALKYWSPVLALGLADTYL
jgi:hypothetical protein